MSGGVCFVDAETTGLDPVRHEIWEVGLIVDETEYVWQLPVNLARADARALDIGRFHERRLPGPWAGEPYRAGIDGIMPVAGPRQVTAREFASVFRELTWGRHLVGAVVSFDEERLRRLLRACGECPGWHYHLIDVESLAVGWLAGQPLPGGGDGGPAPGQLPWDSRVLSRAVGVDPEGFNQHTALGDARWAKAIYEKCTGVTL